MVTFPPVLDVAVICLAPGASADDGGPILQLFGTRSVTASIVMDLVLDGTDDVTGEADALLGGVDVFDGAGAWD